MKVVVIGAGFAGACAALLLREQLGADVTLIEEQPAPGGMLRTLSLEDGLTYEYGPRIVRVFRGTPDVLPFLQRFLELEERVIYQGTRLRPDYPVIPFPVDLQSLAALPCGDEIARELTNIRASGAPPGEGSLREYLETSVGPTLTELAFEGFNRKFWGRSLDDMPAEWGKLRRLERIAEAGDFRLPSEAPHYYPRGGFNRLFERVLEGFDLRTNERVERIEPDGTCVTATQRLRADLVVATGPIDELLDYRFGPLEWTGYRIEIEVVDEPTLGTAPDGVPFAWVYTPWPETPICRTTDFGVIHGNAGPAVLLREIVDPSVHMYPVWWEVERFYRYLDRVTELPRVIPLGRLGFYKYVTVDSTLAMVKRMLDSLEAYLGAAPQERRDLLRAIRGDWQE